MPRDLNIGLTDEQKQARRNSLGGSDANIIMSGDDERIYNLWLEKTGQKESEDLSGILPVIMGQFTEPLNIFWYEKQTGRAVTDEQLQVKHPQYSFMACTLDGKTVSSGGSPAIFEAKHVNAFSNIDEVVQRYMPQLHHNASANGLNSFVLSVFVGTLKWELYEGEVDAWYVAQLIEAEEKFWNCVQNKTPPNGFAAIEAPKPPTEFREIDMTGNNMWASLCVDYIDNEKAAKKHEKAKKDLKAMVEDDVGLAFGHGLQIKRGKTGSLSFSKQK
ncbi:MAG: endonuclease [Gammaproteobacteria bacterium]|nr:endonuclease [Gammaproteobacteria bacterium]